MVNKIQNYLWGSKSSLTEIFGIPNIEQEAQAEVWMGTHPNGCSTIKVNDTTTSLSDFIKSKPEAVLSPRVYEHFHELPFLFKILAAESALSIQVHPSKKEAEVGFQREEKLGIAINAYERNYKDSNHKPELVYALTEYQAMNGFKPHNEILSLLSTIKCPIIESCVNEYSEHLNADGLKKLFRTVLSLKGEELASSITSLLISAEQNLQNPSFRLVLELSKQYGDDVGLFAPLMLNVVTLKPGQAMYLDARTPHAYVKGTGLEVMANSDNVLRAGLTNKFIDVDELVNCTEFKEKRATELLLAPIEGRGEQKYPVPVDDFGFSVYQQADEIVVTVRSAEILLSIDSELTLQHSNGQSVTVLKGESVFIPAYAREYTMRSKGRVARVYS